MSDAPSANPLGAGSDIITATEKISQLLNPEPEGQPGTEEATEPANQDQGEPAQAEPVYDEATGRYRDPATNKFVKGPEQETEGDDYTPPEDHNVTEEGADVDTTAEPEEPGEESESEELADTVDGLAEQLGLDASELAESLKARVKINGEESEVTLSELVKGYQMEGDYRLKTAELSEQRRAVQDAEAEIAKRRDAFQSQLDPMLAQLKQYVEVDEQYLNQLAAEGRSDEYLQYKHAADMRRAELERANQAKQTLEQEKTAEQQKQYASLVAENNALLESLKPDWAKDPEKGKQEIANVRRYMKSEWPTRPASTTPCKRRNRKR